MEDRTRPRGSKAGEAAEAPDVGEPTARRGLADGDLEGIVVRGAVRAARLDLERLARRRRYAGVVRSAKAPARFRWPSSNRRGRGSTRERT